MVGFKLWKYLRYSRLVSIIVTIYVSIDDTFVTFAKLLTEVGFAKKKIIITVVRFLAFQLFAGQAVAWLLVLIILIFGFKYFRQPKDCNKLAKEARLDFKLSMYEGINIQSWKHKRKLPLNMFWKKELIYQRMKLRKCWWGA